MNKTITKNICPACNILIKQETWESLFFVLFRQDVDINIVKEETGGRIG